MVRARRLHHEVDPVGGNVDAGQGVDDLVDLGDDDAAAERGGFDDHRGVFGVGAGVEVAVAVGGLGGNECDARGEVDEVAAEQFQVGVDGADLDAPFGDQVGQPHRLRAGEGEVELGGDAAFEHIQVRGQRQHRLHHVQVVDPGRVEVGQALGEEIGLFLVVALQADLVARLQQRVQQGDGIVGGDVAATRPRGGAFKPGLAAALQGVPTGVHRRASE